MKIRSLFTSGLLSTSLLLITALSLQACGEDQAPDDDSKGGSSNDSDDDSGTGGAGGEAPTPAPPLYAVATQQQVGDGAVSYVILTDSLTEELSLDDAVIELPGRGIAAGAVGAGQLFVATNESAELTRYELQKDGKLKENGKISFAPQGVPNFGGYSAQFQFLSDDKAYWFSRLAEKVVIWDPTEFVLKGSIPLTGIKYGTDNISFTGAPLQKGDNLYTFVSWDTRDGSVVKVPDRSAIVVVDTKKDTAKLIVDERCGYARDGVFSGDWLYLATEAVGTAAHYLNEASVKPNPPCLIRFNTKTQAFDEDYLVELNSLAGGAPTGSLLLSPGGKAFVHVLDTTKDDGTITNVRSFSSAEIWKTGLLTVGDKPSIELLDTPLTSASVLPFTLKDGLKVSTTFGAAKRLLEVTEEGLVGTERVDGSVPGTVFSIVQLR